MPEIPSRAPHLLEDGERHPVPFTTPGADDPESVAGPVLPPEPHARHPVFFLVRHRQHPGQLVRVGEEADRFGQPLQLGRGVIAQQPGKGQVGYPDRPTGAHETEPGRGRVAQSAKLFLGVPERVFHPPADHHLRLEVRDLLPEPDELVGELLFGAVLVAHRA